jgi:Zinc finger, C2H2 type
VCHKFTFCNLKLPCKVSDCKKYFKTSQEVANHFANEHKAKSVAKTTNEMVREKVKLERHVCDECGLVLSNIWILRKHKLHIHDPNYMNERKLYPCNDCEKVLLTKYSYEHHVAVFHSQRQFFECHHCPKKFCSLMSIRAHVVEHASSPTALLTVECATCHKMFVDQKNLHQHRKVHIG